MFVSVVRYDTSRVIIIGIDNSYMLNASYDHSSTRLT